ncbi:tRNA (N6-threonylcarbamoyladenosine(37)-N6)-methyltransferase TrmO [Paenibacillus sp. A3]|uniref:tRNA (N6-threonylcarbamoyladenosine(37)-N6)-methyltransferase TrmO n=1 Tax=Paenibacillus sp. A3 TaxID=1337054 RepID=UPI0012F885E0
MMKLQTQESKSFTIVPVGYVQAENGKMSLSISEPYVPALKELAGFSHAQVLWWIHEFDDVVYRHTTRIEPPYDAPVTGVFASRSPVRPNPIGLSTVRIHKVDEKTGKIEISEIDAYPGTPILDIKAYFPGCDRVKNVKVAAWAKNWPEWLPEDENKDA